MRASSMHFVQRVEKLDERRQEDNIYDVEYLKQWSWQCLRRLTCSNRYLTAPFSVESTEQNINFVVQQSISYLAQTIPKKKESQIILCPAIHQRLFVARFAAQAAFEQQTSVQVL